MDTCVTRKNKTGTIRDETRWEVEVEMEAAAAAAAASERVYEYLAACLYILYDDVFPLVEVVLFCFVGPLPGLFRVDTSKRAVRHKLSDQWFLFMLVGLALSPFLFVFFSFLFLFFFFFFSLPFFR